MDDLSNLLTLLIVSPFSTTDLPIWIDIKEHTINHEPWLEVRGQKEEET